MESKPMLAPKKKIFSTEKNLLKEGSNPLPCITQDSEPNTLPTSYSGPLSCVCVVLLLLLLLFCFVLLLLVVVFFFFFFFVFFVFLLWFIL